MSDLNNKEWTTGNIDELAESLEITILGGQILEEFDDGSVLRIALEHKVGSTGALKFEIFSNEHPPPHFRVSYQGETANFSIKDCSKLNGGLDLHLRNIRFWFNQNKSIIIEAWNKTRPTNCPVGEYVE